MTRILILLSLTAVTFAAPANTATPRAYAALDRQTSAACIAASGLRDATIGPVVRFSDSFLMDARIVTGAYPQAHMKGAKGAMLCLYNRRTQRAETQEMALPDRPVASTAVKDVWWQGIDIDGKPVGSSAVNLMFGSDGKVGGKSACNNYSVNYTLTGSDLHIYPGMVGTRMACSPPVMAQEEQFRTLLSDANSAVVKNDGTLSVTGPNGRSLRFQRAPTPNN